MKKILLTLSIVGIFAVGCEETTLVDEIIADTTSGTVLRTQGTPGLELDLFDRTTSISIAVQEQDASFGANFSSMNIYLRFVDNNFEEIVDAEGNTIIIDKDDKEERLVESVNVSSFTTDDEGLPTYSFGYTFSELISALSLEEGKFTGGDNIIVRLEAVMNDGSTWSVDQANANITGGAYFSSPFEYQVNIVCAFPDDTPFTGSYEMVQTTAGVWGIPVFGTTNTNTVTLVNEGGTKRSFQGIYLEQFGVGNGAVPITFNLICDKTSADDGQGSGLGCGSGIQIGTADTAGSFDFEDDSFFTLIIKEDVTNDCGVGTTDVTFEFTKL